MTLADLDRIHAALDSVRAAYLVRASERIASAVADARAHAENAITARLKATADGRPTARRAERSRSLRAACNRLDELLAWLAGPSVTSLDGLVRDARAALYRRAFALHRPLVPPELHVTPDPEPTQANLRLIRAIPLHGLDPRAELMGHVSAVRRALAAAVASAGASGVSGRRERDLLDAWERMARDRLVTAVAGLLSDAVGLADGEALVDLIHPSNQDA